MDPKYLGKKAYRTYFTNGMDRVEIIGNRYTSGFDLPAGWSYTIKRTGNTYPDEYEEYLNDKPAWYEIMEEGEQDD